VVPISGAYSPSLMRTSEDQLRALDQLMRLSPHNAYLGLHLMRVEDGVLTTELPYREDLIGNPETGALHGGVVTAMLDASCGLSVMVGLGRLTRIATLDLRIDYLKPTQARGTLYSRSSCYKLTQQVAFVQGTAFQRSDDGAEDEVAKATGTFMILSARAGAGA
jgi:uncharacterized protein (TIGR00369 family)